MPRPNSAVSKPAAVARPAIFPTVVGNFGKISIALASLLVAVWMLIHAPGLALLIGLPAIVWLLLRNHTTARTEFETNHDKLKEGRALGYELPGQHGWSLSGGISLSDGDAFLERAKLSPFVLWYRDKNADIWKSHMDGNASLPACGPMRNLLELCITENPSEARPAQRLSHVWLAEASHEVILNLNRGPARSVEIDVNVLGTGERVSVPISMGTLGGVFPPAPQPPSDNHGTGKEGDGKDQHSPD